MHQDAHVRWLNIMVEQPTTPSHPKLLDTLILLVAAEALDRAIASWRVETPALAESEKNNYQRGLRQKR